MRLKQKMNLKTKIKPVNVRNLKNVCEGFVKFTNGLLVSNSEFI